MTTEPRAYIYQKFYGFSENPFDLTPNPKFLYLTTTHRKALDSMIYVIKNRKEFASITGEVGTGKTTLIHSLLNSLDDKVKTVHIFNSTVSFEDLLKAIRYLSPDRQQLLILKFVEGMSNAEVAVIMMRSEGAIKSLYHRTLLALRDEMQKLDHNNSE